MRIAIVGCGEIARVHASFVLNSNTHTMIAVCDTDRNNANTFAHTFRIDKTYTNLEKLLQEQRPDVLHVLTPPQSHAALAIQAMQAGCHVLVEKPMALSVEEADAMISVARTHAVKLCVVHNQLFDPVILQAQRIVGEGVVGKVIGIESYYGFNLAQTSERRWVGNLPGGVLQNVAPHPLSLILQFLGEPTELHISTLATGTCGPDVADECRVIMKGKEALGTLSISLASRPPLNFLRLYGSKATLHADLANMLLSVERLRALPKPAARGFMSVEQGIQLVSGAIRNGLKFGVGRLKPYQGLGDLIRRFYESIEQAQDPPVPGIAGRRVVQVLDHIKREVPTRVRRTRVSSRRREGTSTVFVTGATGFLGSHLVERLTQQGTVVRALVRPTSRIGHLRSLDIDWVDGDLADIDRLKSALEGCDVVYHCAAATKGSWTDYLEGTVRGTERLLDASHTVGVRRFVHISSLSVYGITELNANQTVTEDSPIERYPDKRGHYACSKIHAEKIASARTRDGMPITILRPGTIYGPRGQMFFPRLGYALGNKLFLVIGGGTRLLPLTYVENVVDAICLAAMNDQAIGQVYNIVDDDPITERQYVDELVNRTTFRPIVLKMPRAPLYLIASLLEVRAAILRSSAPPFVSRYRLTCATKPLRYDAARAKNQLGWIPAIPIREGLDRTFDWYNKR